ncbi:MAG: class I SAM-dependent methyltransferase [Acidobacteriota bacterium]|nr:class I SAM-dependent methyltransferase [Acidobacteriota bacterium]
MKLPFFRGQEPPASVGEVPFAPSERPVPDPKKSSVAGLEDSWSDYARNWRNRQDVNDSHKVLGEEWGSAEQWKEVFRRGVEPFLKPDAVVVELGCGGGKWSRMLAGRCRLICTDISSEMLEGTRAAVGEGKDVEYRKLSGFDFGAIPARSVDFIFSYDVLLHVEPQVVFSYLLDAKRILKPGGVFLLHQINILSPGGQLHFRQQFDQGTWRFGFADPGRHGHIYYSAPEVVRAMASMAGFDVIGMDTELPLPGQTGHDGRDILAHLRPRSA